jgi:hypothetical protein
MAGGGNYLDMFHPRVRQTRGYKVRGPMNVARVGRLRADAGDAEELLQLIQEAFLVGFDESTRGWRHLPL